MMADIIAFIKQNFKWLLIVGSIIGICIIGYIVYSIYNASNCANGACSVAESGIGNIPHDDDVEYCTMDGHCSTVNSTEGFEEKHNARSDDDDDAEPIETYSSIDDNDEH